MLDMKASICPTPRGHAQEANKLGLLVSSALPENSQVRGFRKAWRVPGEMRMQVWIKERQPQRTDNQNI